MKKILSLMIALAAMFLLTACGNTTGNIESEKSRTYMTFEQLAENSTDIIKGKCLNAENYNGISEYEFLVEERFLGENVNGNIFVRVLASIDNSAPIYEEGKEYYLLLSRRMSVYSPHDIYLSREDILMIPADDVSKGTMYGERLTKNSEIKSLDKEKDLTDYLSKLAKKILDENKWQPVYNGKYITDTDMASVINKSPVVLKVSVGEMKKDGLFFDGQHLYECTVTEALKGTASVNEVVQIVFSDADVVKGKEYIVALEDSSDTAVRMFNLSSKKSIFDVSLLDEIRELLPKK